MNICSKKKQDLNDSFNLPSTLDILDIIGVSPAIYIWYQHMNVKGRRIERKLPIIEMFPKVNKLKAYQDMKLSERRLAYSLLSSTFSV